MIDADVSDVLDVANIDVVLHLAGHMNIGDPQETTMLGIVELVEADESGSAPACPPYDAGLTAADDAQVRNR